MAVFAIYYSVNFIYTMSLHKHDYLVIPNDFQDFYMQTSLVLALGWLLL